LEGQGQPNLRAFAAQREDWELSKRVIEEFTVRCVITIFKPFKSAGLMDLYLYSYNKESILTTHLCHIFRVCLARGYIPKAGKQVQVTFLTKPRKANYIETKAHCPNSLVLHAGNDGEVDGQVCQGPYFWAINTNSSANQECPVHHVTTHI
jgi:hypothetical protein